MLAYFIDKLQSTPDGMGTCSTIGRALRKQHENGNQHDHDPLPVVVSAVSRTTEGRQAYRNAHAHSHVESVAPPYSRNSAAAKSFGDSTANLGHLVGCKNSNPGSRKAARGGRRCSTGAGDWAAIAR